MTEWLQQTCVACPTVVEGTAPDGRYVRLRYRYGKCTVLIDDEIVYRAVHGDDLDGVMDYSKAVHIAESLWRESVDEARCPECKRYDGHKMDCSKGR